MPAPIDPLVADLINFTDRARDPNSTTEYADLLAVAGKVSAVIAAARAIPRPVGVWLVVIDNSTTGGPETYLTLGGTTTYRDEASRYTRVHETPEPQQDEPWLLDAMRGRRCRLERIADLPGVAAIRALHDTLSAADTAR